MVWKKEYNSGIETVDVEHRNIFHDIQEFHESLGKVEDHSDDLRVFFNCTEDHILRHFSDEEALHREHNYTHADLHKSMHSQFKQVFFALKNRLEREGTSLVLALYAKETIASWMTTHIENMDCSFAEYLKAKTAKEAIPAYSAMKPLGT